ncbi:MAG TPA: antibiotic biosynthesis monooxygenase, partial [Thermodesulfobacteriota bacterium]|nr:antibiotic biosynthesis monooxygenase [Thermodesulfobacteriota bacterium]
MIHAVIRMTIPLKRRAEILEILGSVAERCRFEAGCLSCRIYQDIELEAVVMMEQLWRDREDLEHHLRSEEIRKLLLVMEMSLQAPEVQFNEISGTSGMET